MSRSTRRACVFISTLLTLSFAVSPAPAAQAGDANDASSARHAEGTAAPHLATPPVDHRMKDGSVGGTSEHRTRPAEIAADGEPARVVQNSRVDKAAAAPSVHGEVWDSYSYDPIEGIQVKIWGTDYDYAPRATAVTDVDGSYSVGALPAGDYLVEFSGEGFITRWWKQQSYETSANVITVTTGGPTIEADAELDHLDTITGTLTSSKGKPIAGRWITLDIWNAQGQHWGELDAVMTNAAGHFAFSDLRPGSYAVEGEVPKGARLKAEAHYVDLLSFSGSKSAGLLAPWIVGSPSVGLTQKVDVGPGKWKKATFSYQWLRNGVRIAKATKKTYTTGSADLHAQLQIRVTSRTGNNWATVTSPTSWPILRSSVPQIRGTLAVGSAVSADAGSWEPASIPSYQWYADGKAISGATTGSLTLTGSQSGKRLTVKVSGRFYNYPVISRTSAPTARVLKAGSPTISGSTLVGSTLKAAPGAWSKRTKFSYRWLRDGAVIGKATKSSYKLTAADAGTHISVRITGRLRGYGTVSMTSAPLAIPA